MLLLPKGETIHSGLKTAFTEFDAMLAELRSNGFTGYVHLTAPSYEGLLLLDTGRLLTAIDEWQGQRCTGPQAAQQLAAQARTKGSIIDVCKLRPEWVGLLSGMAKAEIIYGNLSTDVVELEALIKKLQDTHHSGYVQVTFRGEGGTEIVVLHDGELIDFLPFSENGTSPAVLVSRLLQTAAARGADIVVYRADVESALSSDESIGASLDMPRLLDLWQEIIRTVEKTADGLTEHGAFVNAFRNELESHARDHPFLEPSTIFLYKDRRLEYRGVPEMNFSMAVAECLSHAVDKLAAKAGSADLKTRIKLALQTVRESNAQSITALGLSGLIEWDLSLFERVVSEAGPFLGAATERIVERQCREHLRIEPSALKMEQLGDLARWMEISSALVISKDQTRALRQKVEGLAGKTRPASPTN